MITEASTGIACRGSPEPIFESLLRKKKRMRRTMNHGIRPYNNFFFSIIYVNSTLGSVPDCQKPLEAEDQFHSGPVFSKVGN
jgi:hypothetical protein